MSTMTTAQRQARLDELTHRRQDLRRQLNERRQSTARLREQLADDQSGDTAARLARSVNAEEELRARIEDVDAKLNEAARDTPSPNGASWNGSEWTGGRDGLILDPDAIARIARDYGHTGQVPHQAIGMVDREHVASWTGRALAQNNNSTGSNLVVPSEAMVPAQLFPTVPLPSPPPTFLDLLQSVPLDGGNSIEYTRQLPTKGGPAPVEPGDIKPTIGITWEDASAAVTTIAAWTKVHRNMTADIAGLQTEVRDVLVRELRLELERQVLTGDGSVSDRTGQPGLVGLTNDDGVQTVAADPHPTSLRRASADMRKLGGRPNFVALGVDEMDDLMTATDEAGSFLLTQWGAPGAGLVANLYQPVEAPGLPDGTGVIGDTGALTLIVREPARIIIGTESDDLIRNRVTVLIEWRGTLLVRQPTYIVLVNLGAEPAVGG